MSLPSVLWFSVCLHGISHGQAVTRQSRWDSLGWDVGPGTSSLRPLQQRTTVQAGASCTLQRTPRKGCFGSLQAVHWVLGPEAEGSWSRQRPGPSTGTAVHPPSVTQPWRKSGRAQGIPLGQGVVLGWRESSQVAPIRPQGTVTAGSSGGKSPAIPGGAATVVEVRGS